jgi:hypothetical protein
VLVYTILIIILININDIVSIIVFPNVYESTKCDNNVRVTDFIVNDLTFKTFFFQTCLRHPECTSSRENRDTVFCHMRRAIDLVHYVVKDGLLQSSSDHANDVRTPGNGSSNSSSVSNQPKEVWRNE